MTNGTSFFLEHCTYHRRRGLPPCNLWIHRAGRKEPPNVQAVLFKPDPKTNLTEKGAP